MDEFRSDSMEKTKVQKIAYINIGIMIINVIVFLWVEWGGSSESALWMVKHGAVFIPYIIENGEYYRLFTAMFLHFGVEHLIHNMLILFIVGGNLERALERIKYLLFYLLCGVGSNLVSMLFHMNKDEMIVSAGASGAIFGVVGGLLWAVIRNKGHLEELNTKQIAFMMLVSLYLGFLEQGVDNTAHVSGAVIGFVLSILLYRKPKERLENYI